MRESSVIDPRRAKRYLALLYCHLRTPRPHRHAPVNAFQKHRQLRRRQRHRAILGLRPDEAALLHPLRVQTQTLAIPAQHLHQITATAAEREELPAERILTEMQLHQGGEPIETLTHVSNARGQPYTHARRRCERADRL